MTKNYAVQTVDSTAVRNPLLELDINSQKNPGRQETWLHLIALLLMNWATMGKPLNLSGHFKMRRFMGSN